LIVSLLWIGIVVAGAVVTGTLLPHDIAALFRPAPPFHDGSELSQDIAELSHRLYRIATLRALAVVTLIAAIPPLATVLVLRHQINRARH
jgi:hypothetical protein